MQTWPLKIAILLMLLTLTSTTQASFDYRQRSTCIILSNSDAPYFPLAPKELNHYSLRILREFAQEYALYKDTFRDLQKLEHNITARIHCPNFPEIPAQTRAFLNLNMDAFLQLDPLDRLSLKVFQKSYKYHFFYMKGAYHQHCGDISALAPSNLALFIKENEALYVPYLSPKDKKSFKKFKKSYFKYVKIWLKHDFARKPFYPYFPEMPSFDLRKVFFTKNNIPPNSFYKLKTIGNSPDFSQHSNDIKEIFKKHEYFLKVQKEYIQKFYFQQYQKKCLYK